MAQPYELDHGFGDGLRLGLIVLSTDESLENEARTVLAGRPLSLLHARIPAEADVTPEKLAMMAEQMTATAERLPRGLDVIGYGCTSASTIIGPDRVAALIRKAHPGVKVSTPITAVTAALKALGVGRVGYGSPYVKTVTAPMRAYLAEQGIDTVAEASFDQGDDYTVARITEDSTRNMLNKLAENDAADGFFASCTNLRTFGIIDTVEAETGRPVVSSNQAMLWHMLQLAGVDARGWGPGRLFQTTL
ncbi:Asp/Glu racemase [Lutimaribacter sp. EGI FJ00015]|uniref:Asp/Glu racemase n=1 Tax=Lutimaribacter degradans TaxID=2945989 RepID=A0ACC5ZVM1_9RHOB|nr:Asp/Glu racemase [Lutimaribacter sp. EGI FJ00013]MCM2562403.1 Asp/Glu racemase [Lutimaribacter sp. EGI FJ00013]MCO0613560.1 Asp/Glu racemase [Lutimaribacter sp. EGI FJ00015]MCO0636532.1 Asp/Glu racemase [Lutimaribacter sp. EGI FJ00014]